MESQVKITIERQPVVVSRLYKTEYNRDDAQTVELKQCVLKKTEYHDNTLSSDLSDNLYSHKDFRNESSNVFVSPPETRVTWLNIPEEVTLEEFEERLNKAEGACIYKILSNSPILTQAQQYAVNNPNSPLDIEHYCKAQVVRYPATSERAGEIVLDPNGRVQYRATFFSATHKDDVDERSYDVEGIVPEFLLAELEQNAVLPAEDKGYNEPF